MDPRTTVLAGKYATTQGKNFWGKVSYVSIETGSWDSSDVYVALDPGDAVILCKVITADCNMEVLLALPGEFTEWVVEFLYPGSDNLYDFIISQILVGSQILYVWEDVYIHEHFGSFLTLENPK